MRKGLTRLSLTLSLIVAAGFSVAAENDVVKVYDKGWLEGGMRLYTIVCPNGRKTSVTQTIETAGTGIVEQAAVETLSETGVGTSSVESTTQNLKQKFLKLIGQQNRAEMCLYPANAERECKNYKDVDAAAEAACELIQ
jgi:hypothetical protein